MPIYAYRCDACGHAKDVLQKLSDPVLSTCPACGADAFRKQLTAAGFQLKGSGWYVTDFKGGAQAAKSDDAPPADAKPADAKPVEAAESKSGDSKSTDTQPADAKPADRAATPAAAPAAPAAERAPTAGEGRP